MIKNPTVAVCSRSFSNNQYLRKELEKEYDSVIFNDLGKSLSGKDLIDFLSTATHAIIALEDINEEILNALPRLKVVSKYGVGIDKLDLNALSKYNIKLGWTGGVNKRSVSELVISFSISLLRNTYISDKEVKNQIWRQHVGRLLTNKIVGIIGCGHIGKDLVELLQPFQCKVIVNDIIEYKEFNKKNNIKFTSLNELLRESDIVTIHTPLNHTTKNILSSEKLRLLKEDSILINLARGGLVDESYLKTMLKSGAIRGAALDVFNCEPPNDDELINMHNIITTSHIGGSAQEAIIAMGLAAIDGLKNNQSPELFKT